MKETIFFKEQGLTSTSANHIANLAKEAYQELEKDLDSIMLYTTKASLISASDYKELRKGEDDSFVKEIESKLERIAKYKSLIAWLREAIKARIALKARVENYSTKEIADLIGAEYPKEPERKEAKSAIDADDYWATKTIKERNHYYQLETECAVLGKAIHPDGYLARARKRLFEVIKMPNEVRGSGRDTVIYTYIPTAKIETVEAVFFSLQKKHRAYQAELNKLKHECDLAVEADQHRYLEEEAQYSEEFRKEYAEYNQKMDELIVKVKQYRQKELERIAALKIVIPDSLKGIYNEITSLG